jgi:hypothetical protein
VHPDLLHKFHKIQAHFVCTTFLYPHLPQFILFVLVAAMWGHLILIATFILHITPMCTIWPAATVNSCLVVRLLPGACFLRHSQSSRLFYLVYVIFINKGRVIINNIFYLWGKVKIIKLQKIAFFTNIGNYLCVLCVLSTSIKLI